MKKHILSKHISAINNSVSSQIGCTNSTRDMEISDPDDFIFMATTITGTQENTDPDDFVLGATIITKNMELSDPDDYLNFMSTKHTFECGESDPDEFDINYNNIDYSTDFDEILLI